MNLNQPEPMPLKNNFFAVWDLVIRDMYKRDSEGFKKYGTRLQPFNGRNSLVDAYQEVLDQSVYLRQAIHERDEIARVVTELHRQILWHDDVENLAEIVRLSTILYGMVCENKLNAEETIS